MKKLLLSLLFTCTSYAAFSNATVSQKDWRWRKDDGDEVTATWAAEDQALSKSFCAKETIRLRMSFLVQYDPAQTTNGSTFINNNYSISYATDVAGTYTVIPAPSATSNGEHFFLSGSPLVHYNNATEQLSTTASESASYREGKLIDSSSSSSALYFSTPAMVNTFFEYEWLIAPSENAQAQTYYFKLEGLNGTYATLPSHY